MDEYYSALRVYELAHKAVVDAEQARNAAKVKRLSKARKAAADELCVTAGAPIPAQVRRDMADARQGKLRYRRSWVAWMARTTPQDRPAPAALHR